MLKRFMTAGTLIIILAVVALFAAYGHLSSITKEDPKFQFWLEASKYLMQFILITSAGAFIAGLVKAAFDLIQAKQQAETAKDQFRKEILKRFIDARYEVTNRRDMFLSAPHDKLEDMYRAMMQEDFIRIKEDLSRAWHDVETGKQSITYAEDVKKHVTQMKSLFDDMLAEYREIKDGDIPGALSSYKEMKVFGDFLQVGDKFKQFLDSYRSALYFIRLDLLRSNETENFLANFSISTPIRSSTSANQPGALP